MRDADDGAGSTSQIAIIGMACRFPGAPDPERFWANLSAGRESITFFSEDELRRAGVAPALLANPAYVRAGAVLGDIEQFDAAFFGFSPREAEVLDVQHRLFLECAWEALEAAGVNPDAPDQVCGVFAGCGPNTYLLSNLYRNAELVSALGFYQVMLASDKDYLSTRVAYKLNLRGPALTIQTACSTSLVAVHVACQSILAGECDLAIAGGVSVRVPHVEGYLHQEGMILSPDGHCRAFDRQARGTVGGNGAGTVVLKRLESAIRDGDHVRAVIRGTSINNDGALKAGYVAPSVQGQAAVIAEALAIAGLRPADISYVEAHGTGTPVGDPIEVAALKMAFGSGPATPWCALGSVKTNIGHTDTAAGVAGLIKTVLALEQRQIPPSLHFREPNPELQLSDSPFYVNSEARPWQSSGAPRRAGVSSFGIGGTNAHVVLEEAPRVDVPSASRPAHVLIASAKTATALDPVTANLAARLTTHPDDDLGDVAFTLSNGRKMFAHRRAVVCRNRADAIHKLSNPDAQGAWTGVAAEVSRPVAFTFSGQGLQYPNIGAGLYTSEPFFRELVDHCADVVRQSADLDIVRALFGGEPSGDGACDLDRTALSQPALFIVQFAMARLWMHWGIEPALMLGHSLGEYVAACLGGVFALEDALVLVCERGRLMQQMPPGAMLSVSMREENVRRLSTAQVAVAAINAPDACVVSGPLEEIEALHNQLRDEGVDCVRLKTSHAFHSGMMDPILRTFADRVALYARRPPSIPFISNVTGTWITSDQAQDPEYWARHLRATVRFLDGIQCVLRSEPGIIVEVGPTQSLVRLCRALRGDDAPMVVSSVRHPKHHVSDTEFLLDAVARVWLTGANVHWRRFYEGRGCRKVPLPTYPFERQTYWVEPRSSDSPEEKPPGSAETVGAAAGLPKRVDRADWFYVPSWRRAFVARHHARRVLQADSRLLVFVDDCGVASALVSRLGVDERRVVSVKVGSAFTRVDDRCFVVNPRNRSDYDALLSELVRSGRTPDVVLHLWNVTPDSPADVSARIGRAQDLGFFSLLSIGQSLAAHAQAAPISIVAISNNLHHVAGEERLCPEKATMLGPVTVLPKEGAGISARSIDVVLPPPHSADESRLIALLASEVMWDSRDPVVALRDGHRWIPAFEPVRLDPSEENAPPLDPPVPVDPAITRFVRSGIYLITGGLGGIGLTLAEHLARTVGARLVLTSRGPFVPHDQWDTWPNQGDRASRVIHTLRALEHLGAQVLVAQADVTNVIEMRNVCRQALQRFGRIDGVIHAAGVPGGGIIELKTREAAERVLAPKLRGAVVLAELAREFGFESLIFCSSLTAVVPEFGQVDYVAANAFLDAYVPFLRRQGLLALGVNWDTWHSVGMAVDARVPADLAAARRAELDHGIGPDEGPDVLRRIAFSGLPRVVVSTRDLHSRIARLDLRPVTSVLDGAGATRSSAHPRPSLSTPYVAPSNQVERTLATAWEELLGIEPIGTADSFFELGGHSLLAIQLIARIAAMFHVSLTLTSVFEHPTVAGVASLVEGQTALPSEPTRRSPLFDSTAIPLSFSQQQLWLAEQMEPATARYNEFGVHEISGPLNVDALRRSFQEIVRRHEVLRTTFSEHD
jgi:acyl transferase domain-containing protein/acyl carrier protein